MKQHVTLVVLCLSLFCFSQTKQIDSLTVALAFQEQDSTKVKTSLELIDALYNAGSYYKAQKYIENTERLSKALNDTKGIAVINYYKALIYDVDNDYYNAMDHYNRSLKYYNQIGDSLGVAKVNNRIGLIEIKRGNYAVGLKNSLSAIQTFEKRNLKYDLSDAYNNLGEAYDKTNQIEKSLEYNIKALAVREQLNDSAGIKVSMYNIAKLYSKRKEHWKAIEYYEKTLRRLDTTLDKNLLGEILPSIGSEYVRFRNYNKAKPYLYRGLKFNRKTNNTNGVLSALNALGEMNMQLNKLKTAAIQIDEAYGIAKDSKNKQELLKNYKLHKELDSIRGRYQNAFSWQSKYYDLKYQLTKEDQPKIINSSENKTSQNTGNLPSISLDTNEDLKKEHKEHHNVGLITYLLGAALLLITALFSLFYFKRKDIFKLNKTLKDNNARLTLKNTELIAQTNHLEEVNNIKDRLFSIVSHDLKDSISSIKGFIDLLKEDSISQEEFYDLVPELSENADSASQLLYNLLNWSKSQMQNLEPNAELFNVQDVFRNKISLVEQKIEQKRIIIIDESRRDFIYADKSMIEIVIQNLITNAVKFTRINDSITVSNSDHNGKSLICIEDTGVGISKENIKKLFADSTFSTRGTNNEKGTGLGLSICKELVELNKGRIWVESTIGIGSKFYIELPKMAP